MRCFLLLICAFLPSLALGQYPVAPVAQVKEVQQVVAPAPQIVYQSVQQAVPRVIYQAAPQVIYQQSQQASGVCPNCGRVHGPVQQQQQVGGSLLPGEINRNSAAYAHARREASILAQQGDRYPNRRDGGHPLGPGGFGRRGGTGVSMDGRPNHCFDTAPQSQIVARAAVRGTWRGRPALFWSAILN